jgi:hypothetical protein
MESTESEMIVIAYITDGWFLVDLRNMNILSGRFTKHKDAKDAATSRAYRISQGWVP